MARLLVFLLALGGATLVRADLLVLQADAPGPGLIARVDVATGVARPSFGHDNEGLLALCVDAKGDIFASADLLGAGLIYRFAADGRLQEKVADVPGTDFRALAVGPDGSVYGLAFATDAAEAQKRPPTIVRFPRRGAPRVFARELVAPRAMAFDAEGNLFVADDAQGVVRFDGRTGASLGPLTSREISALAFGGDGQLYAVDARTQAVLQLDARSGAALATIVPGEVGARALAFGPEGDLYAATRSGVLRFEARSGAYRGVLDAGAFRVAPHALAFVEARR